MAENIANISSGATPYRFNFTIGGVSQPDPVTIDCSGLSYEPDFVALWLINRGGSSYCFYVHHTIACIRYGEGWQWYTYGLSYTWRSSVTYGATAMSVSFSSSTKRLTISPPRRSGSYDWDDDCEYDGILTYCGFRE